MPHHRPVSLLLALACAAPAVAAGLDSDLSGGNITFNVVEYPSAHFNMGIVSDRWSDGVRYEIDSMMRVRGGNDRVEASGGAYGYWEERSWKGQNNGGHADYTSYGIGAQGGCTVHIVPRERPTQLDIVPYGRIGFGGQDLTVRNVPILGGGTVDLSTNGGRLEVAIGADLRLTLFKKLVVTLGGGWDYWSSADIYITAGSGGGSIGVVGNSYHFNGSDGFVRLGAGFAF